MEDRTEFVRYALFVSKRCAKLSNECPGIRDFPKDLNGYSIMFFVTEMKQLTSQKEA